MGISVYLISHRLSFVMIRHRSEDGNRALISDHGKVTARNLDRERNQRGKKKSSWPNIDETCGSEREREDV